MVRWGLVVFLISVLCSVTQAEGLRYEQTSRTYGFPDSTKEERAVIEAGPVWIIRGDQTMTRAHLVVSKALRPSFRREAEKIATLLARPGTLIEAEEYWTLMMDLGPPTRLPDGQFSKRVNTMELYQVATPLETALNFSLLRNQRYKAAGRVRRGGSEFDLISTPSLFGPSWSPTIFLVLMVIVPLGAYLFLRLRFFEENSGSSSIASLNSPLMFCMDAFYTAFSKDIKAFWESPGWNPVPSFLLIASVAYMISRSYLDEPDLKGRGLRFGLLAIGVCGALTMWCALNRNVWILPDRIMNIITYGTMAILTLISLDMIFLSALSRRRDRQRRERALEPEAL